MSVATSKTLLYTRDVDTMDQKSYQNVICCIKQQNKFNAIREVIDGCSVFSGIEDLELFKKAVIRREKIETTGIGRGVAIAHGKLKSVDKVRVGLGISAKGIDFDASDGKPVHLLFVIGSSPFKQIDYLRALASIMRFIKMTNIREELLQHSDLDFSDEKEESCLSFLNMLVTQHFSRLNDPSTKFAERA